MKELKLYQFLNMTQHEQKIMINKIKNEAHETSAGLWNDGETTAPDKPGYYAVISGYKNRKASQHLTVARWSGTEWRDCYDDLRSTSGKYTALDIIRWCS